MLSAKQIIHGHRWISLWTMSAFKAITRGRIQSLQP